MPVTLAPLKTGAEALPDLVSLQLRCSQLLYSACLPPTMYSGLPPAQTQALGRSDRLVSRYLLSQQQHLQGRLALLLIIHENLIASVTDNLDLNFVFCKTRLL